MRLLNVDTFEFAEFFDHRDIWYAILSHTWDAKEVSFVDMKRGLPYAKSLPYFKKIRGACRQAANDGFQFVWVDTCCIDTSSSAELSEAINSMFRWYSDAKICYAYLSDVVEEDSPKAESQFRNSRWFTRGWTLQELLAPKKIVFYSREWVEMGSKKKFRTTISEITGINLDALRTLDIASFSVAERMSWAAHRVTTRQEDIAYCLLGLFDVNMALLYGEGGRAFIRLEEEIIKSSDDHSIFAWTSQRGDSETGGLLATSPSQFRNSRGITIYQDKTGTSRPYSMTNKGLSIKMDLVRGYRPQEYFALLDCCTAGGSYLAICLRELGLGDEGFQAGFSHASFSALATSTGDQLIRVRCRELYAMQSRDYDVTAELFVRQTAYLSYPVVNGRGDKAFKLVDSPSFRLHRVVRSAPSHYRLYPGRRDGKLACIYGNGDGNLVDIPESVNDWVATAIFRDAHSKLEVRVMLGWTSQFGISVHVCESYDENSDGDTIGVELRPPSNRITEVEVRHQFETLRGEPQTELIPVSVRVDLRFEQDSDALYNVTYEVIVHDNRPL
ncbi:hypothetical protein VE03_02340 [Pseudogymnoascus sp. 23342-1-I1]|nr:hypothetical protein VE03_02340 [Pseudogymnoascus sp. 23342-1-I1]